MMAAATIRAYAAAKRFRSATIERWLTCSDVDQRATFTVVERLRLGENQVRDLLDTLGAIVARHGGTMGDVLTGASVCQVLAAGQGRNETLHALKATLRRLRFPQLAEAETCLQALVKELGLPSGVSLRFPENLEGDEITLSVRGTSAADLRRRLAATGTVLVSDRVDEMFRVLGGEW